MSYTASWSYRRTATIWRTSEPDQFNRVTFTKEFIKVNFEIGGKEQFIDANGISFTPAATIYTELLDTSGAYVDKLNIGDYFAVGEILADNPTQVTDTFKIRAKTEYDMAMFNEINDFMYMA